MPKYRRKGPGDGSGVLIGIVDTGIDVSHPAFAGRVLKIWDQEIQGQGTGPGFSKLGTVLTGAAMTASEDVHGHRTHVAGIAGGCGAAYDDVATAADFLIVKTNFQNSAIVEAVRWIFDQAEKLGRPCVVNLSLGGHYDGHDWQDDTSVAISDECRAGRLVVVAAYVKRGNVISQGYRVMAGTSMAAPVVAGLLALLLETAPQTTPAAAKQWLKQYSNIPHGAPGDHDIKWGYGLIKV